MPWHARAKPRCDFRNKQGIRKAETREKRAELWGELTWRTSKSRRSCRRGQLKRIDARTHVQANIVQRLRRAWRSCSCRQQSTASGKFFRRRLEIRVPLLETAQPVREGHGLKKRCAHVSQLRGKRIGSSRFAKSKQ